MCPDCLHLRALSCSATQPRAGTKAIATTNAVNHLSATSLVCIVAATITAVCIFAPSMKYAAGTVDEGPAAAAAATCTTAIYTSTSTCSRSDGSMAVLVHHMPCTASMPSAIPCTHAAVSSVCPAAALLPFPIRSITFPGICPAASGTHQQCSMDACMAWYTSAARAHHALFPRIRPAAALFLDIR